MQALRSRGFSVDILTVSEELERAGKLTEVGGPAYLAELIGNTPSSMGAESYAQIITEKAGRRRLLDAANSLARAAYDEGKPIDDAVIAVTQLLTGSIQPRGAAVHLSKYVEELMDDVEERSKNPKDIWGLETGVLDFDKITGGLQAGEVCYLGGDPGIGKSILSMQMGIGMATKNHPGAIYSLEMKGLPVTRRIVSEIGELDTRKLKSGRLLDSDWPIFIQACEAAIALPVYLSDDSYWTTAGLRADMARLRSQNKIEWFVLDYLLLVCDGDGKLDEIERSALLSRRVKALAKEFDLAGITVNSVTKDGSDIRGSNQVKHDADVILMLGEHQPEVGKKEANMRTAVFKKGRELAEPKTYFHLVKADHFPAFRAYTPEDKSTRGAREYAR
jgi:replicative DNA helicase